MKRMLLLCGFALAAAGALAQNTLRGVVLDEDTKMPVKNIRVWIPGGPSDAATTGSGEFRLDLDAGVGYRAGKTVQVFLQSKEYGYHQKSVTLPENLKGAINIEIAPNGQFGIFAVVKDKKTDKLLPDVEVTITPDEPGAKSALVTIFSNRQGMIRYIFNKDEVGFFKYARFFLRAKRNNCEITQEIVQNIEGPVLLLLDFKDCNASDLRINTLTPHAIPVRVNDRIRIGASGSINLGPWVGVSGPEGRTTTILGFPIDPRYSYFPNFSHGALLVKFSWEGDTEWRFCENQKSLAPAAQDGYLEFMINDKDQGNNSGYFEVRVLIE